MPAWHRLHSVLAWANNIKSIENHCRTFVAGSLTFIPDNLYQCMIINSSCSQQCSACLSKIKQLSLRCEEIEQLSHRCEEIGAQPNPQKNEFIMLGSKWELEGLPMWFAIHILSSSLLGGFKVSTINLQFGQFDHSFAFCAPLPIP